MTAKRELAKKERDQSIIHEREGLKKERKQKLNKRAGKKIRAECPKIREIRRNTPIVKEIYPFRQN